MLMDEAMQFIPIVRVTGNFISHAVLFPRRADEFSDDFPG